MCVQRKVTRLPAPYGSCMDPASADATMNAYADFYPVKYTPSVSQFHGISIDKARYFANQPVGCRLGKADTRIFWIMTFVLLICFLQKLF